MEATVAEADPAGHAAVMRDNGVRGTDGAGACVAEGDRYSSGGEQGVDDGLHCAC